MPEMFESEILREFTKCPWCGSTEFMMRGLGEELKEAGLVSSGLPVGLVEVGGTILDEKAPVPIIPGSVRAGRYALRDICMGCGREVTVQIVKKPVLVNAMVTRQ